MTRTGRDRKETLQAARATNFGDGLALTTMAGGVVLGTVAAAGEARFAPIDGSPEQALPVVDRGAQTAADTNQAAPSHPKAGEHLGSAQHQLATQPADAEADVNQGGVPVQVIPSEVALAGAEDNSSGSVPGEAAASPAASEEPVPPTAPALGDHSDLAGRLSEQIADGVARMVEQAQAGLPLQELGHELAQDIQSTVSELLSAVPTAAAIVANVQATLDATDPFDVLQTTVGDLAAVPQTLLGAEHALGAPGLLEDMFYRDGASDIVPAPAGDAFAAIVSSVQDAAIAPTIAELSDGAGAFITDLPPLELGLIGQGYGEGADGHAPSLLNALHLA